MNLSNKLSLGICCLMVYQMGVQPTSSHATLSQLSGIPDQHTQSLSHTSTRSTPPKSTGSTELRSKEFEGVCFYTCGEEVVNPALSHCKPCLQPACQASDPSPHNHYMWPGLITMSQGRLRVPKPVRCFLAFLGSN